MDIDIFIKSYKNDFKWLYVALKSIEVNVTGYREIVLVIPKVDSPLLDYRLLPKNTRVVLVDEYGNGYLYQQVCKLKSYKYTNAEFIMFGDSDCIFDHPINLQDYLPTPEILFTDWSKVGDAICWKQPTETMMGEPVEFEWMRRNCLIYHRSTLENIGLWQPNLEFIIMGMERFSEFNLIGAYAYKFEREKYNFVNTDNWTYTPPKAVQYHSWTEFEKMKLEFPNF